MATLRFVVLCIALFAGVANAQGYRPTGLPNGAQLGDSCTPRRHSIAKRCGEATLIGQTETELGETDGIEGPNVCRVSKMYMQQTRGYTYQEFRIFRGFSFTDCFVTNQCNGTMANFTNNTIDCCDGFAQGESMESAAVAAGESFDFIRRYRNHISLRTEGCPVMLRENVMDCLNELALNEFLTETNELPDIVERFESETDPITVFALSNEAFEGLNDITRALLFNIITRETIISAHIGEGSIPENKLFNGQLIQTLASNVSLHIGKTRNSTVKVFYVNGVRISQPNACQARNGVVHIVDNFLPFSSDTIKDVLTQQSSRFSIFQQLAEKADIAELLDVPQKSQTVFAPTNDAFDPGFVDCLLKDANKGYLSTFVLLHISYPAEFTTTLSERNYVPTFISRLKVNLAEELVSITNANIIPNRIIPLDGTDLPARNGVIHAIPEIIQTFTDEQLGQICPGITAIMELVIEPEVTPDPDSIPTD
ncbi:periostin-like [Halichondria panicea]|uniref:periostin-like n=1 Tax=Halichondria panicea TaxID=6063 RepID=UPI00312B67E8